MYTTALLTWLLLLEALCEALGLRGLCWADWRLRGFPVLCALGPLRRLAPWFKRWVALLVMFLPALLLQIGLATLRHWRLDPLLRLKPGHYPDRSIERVDLPSRTGPVPALHIVPRGGAHAAVCVAHGSGCDKTFYAWSLADALVAQGLAVVFLDLDGHGESPRSQAFPAMLENIAGPVAWMRTHYARVGVLGMSLGGALATRAVADGVRVEALAILAAPPQLRLDAQQLAWVTRTEALRLLRPALLPLLADGSLYHVLRAWRTSGIRAEIGTWDLFDALDLLGSVERIAAHGGLPTLFIYGDHDTLIPVAQATRVQHAMPADGQFHLLHRASHISLPIERRTIVLVSGWMGRELKRAESRSAERRAGAQSGEHERRAQSAEHERRT